MNIKNLYIKPTIRRGQVLRLRIRDNKTKNKEYRTIKYKVLEKHKHFVLCQVGQSKECLLYYDIWYYTGGRELIEGKKEEKAC